MFAHPTTHTVSLLAIEDPCQRGIADISFFRALFNLFSAQSD
jgi:hypothetical protein